MNRISPLHSLMMTALCLCLATFGRAQTFSVSITDSTINCGTYPQGALVAAGNGGTSPYFFAWYDNAWTLLSAGTHHWPAAYGQYHVVGSDMGSGVDTATVTIGMEALAFTMAPVELGPGYHTGCGLPNGEIELEVTSGQGPYCIEVHWDDWEYNGAMVGAPSAVFFDSCVSSTSVSIPGLFQGGYTVRISSHNGTGCSKADHARLERPSDPLLRISGELYANGHHVSCDTCADGRFSMSVQGAHGEVTYAWMRIIDTAIEPDILVHGATLSLPFNWREGHSPTSYDGFEFLAMGTDAASMDTLRPATWYIALAEDELQCMDFKPIRIDGPRPAAGAWHTTGNTADSTTVLGTVNAAPLRLATSDTVRVTIAADGAVGIGTDSIPTGYALAVNGRIIAEEVEVKLHGDWPDFVFEEGYPLPPLDSVNGFIQQNGHLPGFPSASQMQQRGSFASGQMVTALVQKVEELTLYVIQLQQQVQALQKQGAQMDVTVRGLGHAISNAGGNGSPGGPGNGNGQGGN